MPFYVSQHKSNKMNRFHNKLNHVAKRSEGQAKDGGSLLVKNQQCVNQFLANSLHGEPFLGDENIYGSYRYLEKLDERVKKTAEHAAQVAADRVKKAEADAASAALVAIIVAKSKAELRIKKQMLEVEKDLASIRAKADEQRKRSALDVKKMRGERTKKNHFNNKTKTFKKFKPVKSSPLGYEKKYKKCCRSKGSTKDLRRAVLTKNLRRAVSP